MKNAPTGANLRGIAVIGVLVVTNSPKNKSNIKSKDAMTVLLKETSGAETNQPSHPAPDCMAKTPSAGTARPCKICHKPATANTTALKPITTLGPSPFLVGFLNEVHAPHIINTGTTTANEPIAPPITMRERFVNGLST